MKTKFQLMIFHRSCITSNVFSCKKTCKLNCFCGKVDQRKALSLVSSGHHCQRFSPFRISDTPWAGFELGQNLSSGFVEWNCAVVITTTPRRSNKGLLTFSIKISSATERLFSGFINPFNPNALFLYALKRSENLTV